MRSVPIILFVILMAAGNLFAQNEINQITQNRLRTQMFDDYSVQKYDSSCTSEIKSGIVLVYQLENQQSTYLAAGGKYSLRNENKKEAFENYLKTRALQHNCKIVQSTVNKDNGNSTCSGNGSCSAKTSDLQIKNITNYSTSNNLSAPIAAVTDVAKNALANKKVDDQNSKNQSAVSESSNKNISTLEPIISLSNNSVEIKDTGSGYTRTISNIDKDGVSHVAVQTFDENKKLIDTKLDGESVDKLPKEMRKDARAALDKSNDKKADPSTESEIKEDDINTDAYVLDIDKKLINFNENLAAVKSKTERNGKELTPIILKIEAKSKLIKADIDIHKTLQKECSPAAKRADNFCKIARSPQVQAASALMTGLSAALPSLLGAKDTCETTSKTNSIGQSVIFGGTLICGVFKMKCDSKCTASSEKLKTIKIALAEIINYDLPELNNAALSAQKISIEKAAEHEQKKIQYETAKETVMADIELSFEDQEKYSAKQYLSISEVANGALKTDAQNIALSVTEEKVKNVDVKIVQCEKHKLDLIQMGTIGLGMVNAMVQAKKCADTLDASGGSGGGSAVTTTQMCADPANANSVICKCRADNTVAGCPGNIGAAITNSNLDKELGTKGPNQLAGGQFGKPFSGKGVNTDSGLEGISDEAKKVLSGSSEAASAGSGFGTATAANSGGGSGSGGSGSQVAAGKSKEESKSLMGSFSSAIGSFFKGGSSKSNDSKIDKLNSDKYKENIKRQIAAEQARGEISSASGTDNWTKVKTRYKSNSNTLIENN